MSGPSQGIANMGQKVHPLGFRLGVSQAHYSNWCAKVREYSTLLYEDEKIRSSIYDYVRKHVRTSSNYGGVASVKIDRKTDLVQVEIHTAFPAMLVRNRGNTSAQLPTHGLAQIRHNVERILLLSHKKLKMTLVEVDKPYREAVILAEYIALQLESRVAFRKTMKRAMELANEQGRVSGVKIQIAGRLNGAEIARVEWARQGRVPLQALRAQIDYCHYSAHTVYGVLGIKVWVCRCR